MIEVVIGSRGSALALAQANWVADRIKQYNPGVETRIEVIRTKGDKILDTPLAKIGDKGLFVKEIEVALAGGRIDIAVHSMKDLPSEITEGLAIGAIPERADPSDVLLSYRGRISELPAGSRVGSSSLRRRAQLMSFRPDLEFSDLRGNLDTRLRKLESGEYEGIVVAYAGLERLNLGVGGRGPGVGAEHRIGESGPLVEKIPFDVCLPAVGQGALAVQIREDDPRAARLVAPLDDRLARAAVTAERALLAALGGGCRAPIAAVAVPEGDRLTLRAMVASLDGAEMVRAEGAGDPEGAVSLGERIAGVLLDSGGREILAGCDGL